MKYSINFYIKTDKNGIRDAVKQLIPDVDDSRVWNGKSITSDAPDEDGVMVFKGSVCFDTKSGRDGVLNSIKGLAGVIHACESGSFVRGFKYNYDEDKSCEEETILRNP